MFLSIELAVALIGAFVSVVVAVIAHRSQIKINKSELGKQQAKQEADHASATITTLRGEISTLRESNADLRSLNHQLLLELQQKDYDLRVERSEIRRLRNEISGLTGGPVTILDEEAPDR